MANMSGSSWAHYSWNPWQGCDKCAPGCAHCYAFRMMRRQGRDPKEVERMTRCWKEPLKWQAKAAKDGVCERVISCSMSDFFIAQADEWRDDAWEIIRQTPNLIYVLLTKRPERIMGHLPKGWPDEFPNVWLGTSVSCKQDLARVDALRKIHIHPKAIRYLCCGPLLEDIADELNLDGIGWIDVGGETGPGEEYLWNPSGDWKAELKTVSGRRTMKLEWAKRIRDKVKAAGLPFWFAQIASEHRSVGMNALGQLWCEVPAPPLPLPWREQSAVEAKHLYLAEELANLDEAGHPKEGQRPVSKPEPTGSNFAPLRSKLAAIEDGLTVAAGKTRRPLNEREKAKLAGRREAVVAGFESTRYLRGKLLSEYREFFRQSYGLWMQALRAISAAEGVCVSTLKNYLNDYNAAASLPQTVRSALNDKGIDAAKRKNRVLVERLVDIVKSEPGEPDKEQAGQIVADEMMKIPVAPDLSDVSEPLDADEKLRHLIRKGIRQAVANIPIPKRLSVIKAALEEEMWMNWDQKEPITITLTPHWTAITFDGRKLKSDDRTQEVAA
jgi:protein gp37